MAGADLMTKKTVYEHRSVIPTTMERMIAFHEDPRALAMLTPPPMFVQLKRDERTSLTDGEIEFVLWFGPLPIRWVARHEPGPTETSFTDRMLSGPVERWEHQHIFKAVEGGVELTDHVEIVHRSGGFWALFSRLFFAGLPLRMLFFYRHLRTRIATTRNLNNKPQQV